VDYTSLPLDDEPSGWRERFANLSLAGKILIILVPVLALLGVLVLVLTLLPGRNQSPQAAATATPEPVSLTVTKADVIRVSPVTVSVAAETTGLPDGTKVTVELLAGGKPFPFLRPEDSLGQVQGGRVEIKASKLDEAPSPEEGPVYRVRVSTTDGGATGELDLTVPPSYANTFFGRDVAVTPPTATPEATVAPTESPAETVEPTAEPTPTLPSGPEISVTNGGNVRALPIITANNRVGGVDAGNAIQVIERTPNGLWYRIRFANTDDGQQQVGWISASLLTIPADVQAQIPVATIVSVFKNGAIHEKPDSTSTELDRVNVDEVVNLKQKTAAGDWYEVDNVRGKSGWVSADLLGIPADVAAKVPVAP
jgi:flagellar FliL protein